MQTLTGVPGEGFVPELSLAAAALRLGWKQNPVSVVFCIQGVSVHYTKHSNTSSHYHRAAAPRSNKRCSVFNWKRVVLGKSYLLGNDCRNLFGFLSESKVEDFSLKAVWGCWSA